MTSTNRVQIAHVRETTFGTTPGSPRMRLGRMTSDSLEWRPEYMDSEELRADRMLNDSIKVMQASAGGVNGELSYPDDDTWWSDIIRSAMFNTWVSHPSWFNDGTADSVITDAGTTTDTYVVASGGTNAKVGHLVRATGFTNAANNKTAFRVASVTSTTIVGSSLSLTAEAAPPANARLKVVGFEGASGDIVAQASGIATSALNFVTLGLQVGMWIKIGGTASVNRFATAANNGWARVTAVLASILTLDNLPSGWATDNGSGKQVQVWICDMIKNGVTRTGLTIEKGYMAQTTPTYLSYYGMVANTLEFNLANRQKINLAANFMGLGGAVGTVALDAGYDAATTRQIMASHNNVGRLAEGGSALTSPNWIREWSININNNLRQLEAVDSQSPVDIQAGECTVTGRFTSYFGSSTVLAKFYSGAATALNARVNKDNQAVLFDVPRAVYRGGGNPGVQGKNQDVVLALDYQASLDTTMNALLLINRAEYYEE